MLLRLYYYSKWCVRPFLGGISRLVTTKAVVVQTQNPLETSWFIGVGLEAMIFYTLTQNRLGPQFGQREDAEAGRDLVCGQKMMSFSSWLCLVQHSWALWLWNMVQIPTSSQGKTQLLLLEISPSSVIKVVVLHSRSMPLPCMKPILFQKVTGKKIDYLKFETGIEGLMKL